MSLLSTLFNSYTTGTITALDYLPSQFSLFLVLFTASTGLYTLDVPGYLSVSIAIKTYATEHMKHTTKKLLIIYTPR